MVETPFIGNTDDSIEGSLVCILWLLRHPKAMLAKREKPNPRILPTTLCSQHENGKSGPPKA